MDAPIFSASGFTMVGASVERSHGKIEGTKISASSAFSLCNKLLSETEVQTTLIPLKAWPQLPNYIPESHISKDPARPHCHSGDQRSLETLGNSKDRLCVDFIFLF